MAEKTSEKKTKRIEYREDLSHKTKETSCNKTETERGATKQQNLYAERPRDEQLGQCPNGTSMVTGKE